MRWCSTLRHCWWSTVDGDSEGRVCSLLPSRRMATVFTRVIAGHVIQRQLSVLGHRRPVAVHHDDVAVLRPRDVYVVGDVTRDVAQQGHVVAAREVADAVHSRHGNAELACVRNHRRVRGAAVQRCNCTRQTELCTK